VLSSRAMNSPESYIPAPRTYKDVPLVPAVDPADLKRVWNVKPPWTAHSHEEACSPGANVGAVVSRRHMIDTLVTFKMLGPWTHDEQLDDAVFRVAATFPLHEQQFADYMIPGDELHPFDPNAFMQRLVEETGIAHVWDPVPMKIDEDGRMYVMFTIPQDGAASDPVRDARHSTRELLWMIWTRFAGVKDLGTHPDICGKMFADFLVANMDIVERVVQAFREGPGAPGKELLREIEERASRRIWE